MEQNSSNGKRRRRGKASVTILDVARVAEVSPSTVSLFLRRPDEVSAKLQARIRSAIESLPYVPNRLAGGLSASNSRTLVVLIPSLYNTFFAATVNAMQTECDRVGYTLLIGNTDYHKAQEERLVRTFLEWLPAGVILTGSEQSQETIRMLENAAIPVAQMWDIGGRSFGLQIGFDNRQVGAVAARHLCQGGCRNLIFLGARLDEDHRARARANGYVQVVEELGLPSKVISMSSASSQFSTQEAGQTIAAALAENPRIDGVICSNDAIALGVLFEAQRRGIAVPERLSLIGFGDLEFTRSTNPALTTIRLPRSNIGTLAVQRLLARCDSSEAREWPPEVIDVGFELVPRQTTRIVLSE